MEKTKKEIRNRWIAAMCCVLFFVLAYKVTAQVDLLRQKSYDNVVKKPITTIFPMYPIAFDSPKTKGDEMFLSIRADSIGNNIYGITLYSYLPTSVVKHNKIFLVFDNGVKEEFLPIPLDEYDVNIGEYSDVYTKYQITSKSLKSLIKFKCKKVIFEGVGGCVIKNEQTYFKDFLACYYK